MPHRALLAVHDRDARAGEDQEVLLNRLTVVQGVRLAGLHDLDVHAGVGPPDPVRLELDGDRAAGRLPARASATLMMNGSSMSSPRASLARGASVRRPSPHSGDAPVRWRIYGRQRPPTRGESSHERQARHAVRRRRNLRQRGRRGRRLRGREGALLRDQDLRRLRRGGDRARATTARSTSSRSTSSRRATARRTASGGAWRPARSPRCSRPSASSVRSPWAAAPVPPSARCPGTSAAGMRRDDLRELGDVLDEGQAGLIIVYATNMADQVAANIKAANRIVSKATDMAADELARGDQGRGGGRAHAGRAPAAGASPTEPRHPCSCASTARWTLPWIRSAPSRSTKPSARSTASTLGLTRASRSVAPSLSSELEDRRELFGALRVDEVDALEVEDDGARAAATRPAPARGRGPRAPGSSRRTGRCRAAARRRRGTSRRRGSRRGRGTPACPGSRPSSGIGGVVAT